MNKRQKKEVFFRHNFFSKNQRGMSAVITTLIIILLAIVAMGIVWVVVKNIIDKGSDDISLTSLTLDLEIQKAVVDGDTLKVTIRRKGEGNLIAINFVIGDGDNSVVVRRDTNLSELGIETFDFILDDLAIGEITSISVAPIYESNSGKEVIGDIIDTSTYSDGSVGTGGGSDAGGEGGCDPACGEGYNCVDGSCVLDGCVPEFPTCLSNSVECGTYLDDCGNQIDCDAEIGCDYAGGETCGEDNMCYPAGCVDEDPSITCVAPVECGIKANNCGTLVDCDSVLGGCGVLQVCDENNFCQDLQATASGTIDNVWPPGYGIYFDDDVGLPKQDNLYYSYLAGFPEIDTECYIIVGYSYDVAVYPNAIVELFLTQPIAIVSGSNYEIWDNIEDCRSSVA